MKDPEALREGGTTGGAEAGGIEAAGVIGDADGATGAPLGVTGAEGTGPEVGAGETGAGDCAAGCISPDEVMDPGATDEGEPNGNTGGDASGELGGTEAVANGFPMPPACVNGLVGCAEGSAAAFPARAGSAALGGEGSTGAGGDRAPEVPDANALKAERALPDTGASCAWDCDVENGLSIEGGTTSDGADSAW